MVYRYFVFGHIGTEKFSLKPGETHEPNNHKISSIKLNQAVVPSTVGGDDFWGMNKSLSYEIVFNPEAKKITKQTPMNLWQLLWQIFFPDTTFPLEVIAPEKTRPEVENKQWVEISTFTACTNEPWGEDENIKSFFEDQDIKVYDVEFKNRVACKACHCPTTRKKKILVEDADKKRVEKILDNHKKTSHSHQNAQENSKSLKTECEQKTGYSEKEYTMAWHQKFMAENNLTNAEFGQYIKTKDLKLEPLGETCELSLSYAIYHS